MGVPIPATMGAGAVNLIPADFFAVTPGGVLAPAGLFLVPPSFPFGVPVLMLEGIFVAYPTTTIVREPVVI